MTIAQVDLLRPRLLGTTRDEFAYRYCGRRLVPVRGRGGSVARRYDDSGLACAKELHGLLKKVLSNLLRPFPRHDGSIKAPDPFRPDKSGPACMCNDTKHRL